MINTSKFNTERRKSGVTIPMICEALDLCENAVYYKIKGERGQFDINEATKLCRLMNITDPQKIVDIFLS